MARTPVSSGVRTGSRSIALIGRRTIGSVCTLRERAQAVHRLAVRVDHAAEQAVAHRQVQAAVLAAPPGWLSRAAARRHACGAGRGTTRAPLARPCSSPVGIRKARSPLKPTTSASTALPRAWPSATTSHTEPTGTRMPAASSTRPVTRTSVPLVSSGCGSAA